MTPAQAAKLLELPDNATPDQVEARFLDLRRKLEDKIAKAPTPGLQAKYRESLTEITTAFETLTLAADSSSLPVLDKLPAGGSKAPAKSAPPASVKYVAGGGEPAPKPKGGGGGGGKEFLVVALIAVAVLGAGGWWVMKTRAENAEKARIAAEAKAEAERKAAAEKAEAERKAAEEKRLAEEARLAAEAKRQAEEAEKARLAAEQKAEQERRDRALALLRSRLAQLNVQAEAIFVDEPTKAARRLSELKSDERALAREKETGALARLRAQVDAQQDYVDTLEAVLSRHPAKSTQAQAGELVSARELEPATEAVELFATQLAKLDTLVTEARQKVDGALFGSLKIECPQPDVQWTFTDAFGEKFSGRGDQTIPNAGIGTGVVDFTRPTWPGQRRSVLIRRGAVATVAADFRPARLNLTGSPKGAGFTLSDGQKGTLPAEVEVVPGRKEISLTAAYHENLTETIELGIGEQRSVNFRLQPLPLWNQQEVTDFVNGYTNIVRMYAYSGKVLTLGAPADRVSALVTSALPLSVTAGTFAPPPATALKKPGEILRLDYYRADKRGRWSNTGNVLESFAAANVRIMTRPDCDGLVLLAGMVVPVNAGIAWVQPLVVYGATHPDLVPLAQAWAGSVQLTLAGSPPAANLSYRVAFAIKFRRAQD